MHACVSGAACVLSPHHLQRKKTFSLPDKQPSHTLRSVIQSLSAPRKQGQFPFPPTCLLHPSAVQHTRHQCSSVNVPFSGGDGRNPACLTFSQPCRDVSSCSHKSPHSNWLHNCPIWVQATWRDWKTKIWLPALTLAVAD